VRWGKRRIDIVAYVAAFFSVVEVVERVTYATIFHAISNCNRERVKFYCRVQRVISLEMIIYISNIKTHRVKVWARGEGTSEEGRLLG
jgi:hypothetical protein